jgi:NhaA family Na+:H+ antiporter
MNKKILEKFSLDKLLHSESGPGILLIIATALALIVANSPLSEAYEWFINLNLQLGVEEGDFLFEIDKPLLLWINDGLMVFFFLLVGLELKRELLVGDLSEPKKIILPAIGAIGGMFIPALIYWYFNKEDPTAISGWAIPAATDIAFALGLLSLLGSRVPKSLKIFLTSLAIFDDIGAIVIIAIFYTEKISIVSLAISGVCILVLWIFNRRGVEERSMYIFVGTVMWLALLKSGVHATLSGVILAMFIPMHSRENPGRSPVKEMEHDLHAMVAFFCLPIFAFANAGLNLSGVGVEQVFHSVPLGITAGLFIGKQIGIFFLCWLSIKLKMAELPTGMNMGTLYGGAILCGVGFTMSLFIGGLAFDSMDKAFDERLGILLGSLLSAIVGLGFLAYNLKEKTQAMAVPK